MENKESLEKISQPKKPFLTQKLADANSIGSTVKEVDLAGNPDKTVAELMTDEQILDYLNKTTSSLNEIKERMIERGLDPNSKQITRYSPILEDFNNELNGSIKKLIEIGRCPPEFSQEENKS